MINIIDRLDEFLNERENKEKYMIYISIVIVTGLIYYFFNYKMLYFEVKQKQNDVAYVKQNYDIKSYERKLTISKNKFNDLNHKIKDLKDNIKYIQALIASVKGINFFVQDDDLFSFLKNVFSFSIQKNLFPSYSISKQKKSLLKEYTIKIKGETSLKNFINFISMLRYMEKSNYIITFNRVEFNVSKYSYGSVSDFNSTVNIWSYK